MVDKGNVGIVIVVLFILLIFTGILGGVEYDVKSLSRVWVWLGLMNEGEVSDDKPAVIRRRSAAPSTPLPVLPGVRR